MRTNVWRIVSVLVLLTMLISPVGLSGSALAAKSSTAPMPAGMKLIEASKVGVSQPLAALSNKAASAEAPSYLKQVFDRLVMPKTANQSNGSFDASNVDATVGNNMPASIANFEGVNNVNGVLPPDTQGDIGYDPATGNKYYIQWVNLSFQIWDVTNPAAPVAKLAAPMAGNDLFTGLTGICEANNDGDPITLFDHISNRWMMSQFALGFPNDFHQCIAVSSSANPMDPWYLYDFQTSTVVMNDYPHFGVWPDGYYMSVNQFDGVSSGWEGAGVAVFERSQMLQGLPARMIYIDTGAVTLNYGGMLPSDLDGPAPVAGTPNYFMEWDDSTWLSDPADTLRIWEFDTDWVTPGNTTFGLNANFDPNAKIETANVAPLCSGTRNCIDQPDTTQNLDAIADRLMYRLQYRDFGAYQTLVGNHTVDAGSGRAGIHWFELRDTGTGFAIHQDSTYAPADTDNRWMGSIAMDDDGNMSLGFSVASGTVYPSIRYAGRLASDPVNTMAQGEATLIAGTGSQTHSAARWGDYSMMGLDPQDGCTFWFTTEYMQTTSSAGWQTRVGSFKFPSCTPLPTGVLSGTVTDALSAPVAGASVDVDGTYHTTTDASGNYSLNLVTGTYSVVASKYGYSTSTAPAVVVTAPDTTDQDFTLNAATLRNITGTVTDAAGNWPLYARIDITGYPSSPIFTDPVTGQYNVSMVDGLYTFTVVPLSGGYPSSGTPVTVSGDATVNFDLAVDAIACTALGYQYIPGSTLFTDGFDTSVAPAFSANWSVVDVGGTAGTWVTRTVGLHPAGTAVHSAPNMAVFNSWTASGGNSTRLQQLSGYDLSAQANGEVSFWMYHDTAYTENDTVQVQISTDAGVTWNNVGLPVSRHDGSVMWKQHTVNINAYTGAGMTDVRVAFLALSQYGSDVHVDDMSVNTAAQCIPVANAGLIVGNVYDANSGFVLPATVADGSANQALFVNNSADLSEDSPLYIIAEPAGTVNLTASAFKFADGVASPVAVAGGVVRQNFNLASGNLSAVPGSMAFEVTAAAPAASAPLALNNSGGAAAGFEVFAIPGTYVAPAVVGPFAPNTRHIGPKNLNDRNASALRIPYEVPSVPELNAGTVSNSWLTGLTYGWGLGFNTDANDIWVGNIAAGGGDDLNYRFTAAGVNTGDTIDTASWVGVYGGDMTYNPFTKTLWQVNVGGDNCIYEMDPDTQVSTGNAICPAFGTSQRGLAFDPLTNTYYAGSWNDGILNHFTQDGTLLSAVDVGLPIAGLAFNPSTGHLFVIVSAVGSPDVYVLDTNTPNYDIVGAFYIKEGAVKVVNDNQAGLEIDCAGNLYAINQTTQEVFVASSGETNVCNWQASWLSATPTSGSVAATGTSPLTVSVDMTGLATGTHHGYLRIVSDTPYGDEIVPVSVHAPIFEDVDANHWADTWIERLYEAGITGGCSTSPMMYCPGSAVTRAEMAIFLLRGMHGSAYVPPTATGLFGDVAVGSFAADFIERLSVEGITAGCGGGNFCPNNAISRAEMAIFLVRAKHGASFIPPTATGIFDDVAIGSFGADFIEQLYNDGITTGCDANNFCPTNTVTRDQMAIFLVKNFNLP